MKILFSFFLLALSLIPMVAPAQRIGLLTTNPQAPVHVSSSGLVNTPGGLMVLGDTTQGHLELDYDLLQSRSGTSSFLPLLLQPTGGNLNVGSGLIFADRTNKYVGINTASPTTELQVHGEMRMTTAGFGTTQIDKLAIHGNLDEVGTVGLGWLKTSPPIGGGISENMDSRQLLDLYEMYYKSQGAHRWFTNELADVTSPNMILSADGDLGIGPSAPDGKLHLTNGYNTNLTSKGYFQMGLTSSTNMVMDINEIQARSNGVGSTLYAQYWGGNLSLCDNDNGRVGIGLISPSAKLQVVDGVDASMTTHGYIVAGLTTGANVVLDNNEIMARNNGAATGFFIQHDGGNLLLCGTGGGRVGIGITSEANMPAAEYLLAVDGKVIAEEIRVELSNDWPDYVFTEDYNLRPLDQLQKEIDLHGHLPGLPSANEVKADGFELGEMQRKLVEKVEELTLYVLELHRANEGLKREVERLKEK